MLLDTCTLIWLASASSKLSDRARGLIAEHSRQLFVSSISAFELAVKARRGSIRLRVEPGDWFVGVVRHHGIREIPVDSSIAVRSCALPLIHRDPADRIIIATAQLTGLEILTPDQIIGQYPDVMVRW